MATRQERMTLRVFEQGLSLRCRKRSECTLYFCSTKNSPTTRYNYNHGLWQEARICLATVSYAGWRRLRSATCGSSKEGSLKQLVASRSTQTMLIIVYATYYLETWFKILGTMVVDSRFAVMFNTGPVLIEIPWKGFVDDVHSQDTRSIFESLSYLRDIWQKTTVKTSGARNDLYSCNIQYMFGTLFTYIYIIYTSTIWIILSKV